MFLFTKHLETWLGTSLDRNNERKKFIHFRPKKQSFSYYKQTEYKFLTDFSESIKKWISISLDKLFSNNSLYESPPTIE